MDELTLDHIVAAEKAIETALTEHLERVASAGYPTVHVYDDGIDWWHDSAGDELADAESDQFARYGGTGDDDSLDAAIDAHCKHRDAIVDATIAVLRRVGTLDDLVRLVDAASEHGAASAPDSAAGDFLLAVAELAFKQIKLGGADHG